MNAHSQPQTQTTNRPSTLIAGRVPRWAVAALVLQSLTLLCVFTSNGTTTAAGSGSLSQSRNGSTGVTLPNAAQQRAEQTKLLATMVSELEKTNSSLASIEKHLRSGDLEVRQAQSGADGE